MDDAARRKCPTVSAHSLNGLSVLAAESDVAQGFAEGERIILDARHTARYRDAGESVAVHERGTFYCLLTFADNQTRKGGAS